MRVGIYTGRHQRGDASWVFARSFVLALLEALREDTSTEVVVYIHPITLDPRLQEGIELAPVLVTFATNYFYNGASRYFRKLPNGAQCRMLIRFLPQTAPRLVDSLLLGALAGRDKLDVLHLLGETRVPWVPCATVVTLPSRLLLAEQVVAADNSAGMSQPAKRIRLLRALKKANHVICNFESERNSLVRHVGLDASAMTFSPPALDEAFLKAQKGSFKTTQALLLDNKRIEPGFLVLSLPPGDKAAADLAIKLLDALECGENGDSERKIMQGIKVVVLCDDEEQEKWMRKRKIEVPLVVIPRRIHRAIILAHAKVILLLHRGTDRYRGILESLAVGVPVICARDEMKMISPENFEGVVPSVIEIDVQSVESICSRVRELYAAIDSRKKETESSGNLKTNFKTGRARALRGIPQLVSEALAIHRKICMQAGLSRKIGRD